MSKLSTCLWFDGQAQAAASFYVETFQTCGQDASLGTVLLHGETGTGPKDGVLVAPFTLADHDFMALNGGPQFKFGPAISMVVSCDDQPELDRFWQALSDGGETGQCGWLTDRFGVSWQVVPAMLQDWLLSGDRAKSDRVMHQVMQMTKLDIAAMRTAAEGA